MPMKPCTFADCHVKRHPILLGRLVLSVSAAGAWRTQPVGLLFVRCDVRLLLFAMKGVAGPCVNDVGIDCDRSDPIAFWCTDSELPGLWLTKALTDAQRAEQPFIESGT